MMDSLRLESSSSRACKLKDWTCLHGLKSQSAVSFSCESGNHQSCMVCFRRHGECRGCAVPEGSKSEEYKMLKWRKGFGSSVEQSLRKCPFPRCRAYMIPSEEEHHMKICVLRPFTCTEPYRCGRQCENPVPYLEILRHLIQYHSLEVSVVRLRTNTSFVAETKEDILVPALVCKGYPERFAPKLFRIHGRYFLRKVAVIERKSVFCFCLADGGDQEANRFRLIVKICHEDDDAQIVWDTPIPCLRTAEEFDQHFKSTDVPITKHAFAFDCFPIQNGKQRSTVYSFHYKIVDGLKLQPDGAAIRLIRPPPTSILTLQRTGLTPPRTSLLTEALPSGVGIASIASNSSASESNNSTEIESNLAKVSIKETADPAAQTINRNTAETDEDVPPAPKRQIVQSDSRKN